MFLKQRLPLLLVVLGLAFVIVAAFGGVVQMTQQKALTNQTAELWSKLEESRILVDSAQTQIDANEKLYARHWSEELQVDVTAARAAFDSQEGEVARLIAQAEQALKGKDRAQARELLDQADGIMVHHRVLLLVFDGIYPRLARVSAEAEGHVELARQQIAYSRKYLDDRVGDTWSRSHGVTLQSAYQRLQAAEQQWNVAQKTLTTPLVNDNVQVDKPLAYEQATQAMEIALEVQTLADAEISLAKRADSAINLAQSAIDVSRGYIMASNHQRLQAMNRLAVAESDLAAARVFFSQQEWQRALSLAEQANLGSRAATQIAATPTPTPPPTPTPKPTNTPQPPPVFSGGGIWDDDSDSSPSWDYGSGSSGSDSSSDWDSGSNSDSWGSDWDSGSNSDSWGSDWDSDSDNWSPNDGW